MTGGGGRGNGKHGHILQLFSGNWLYLSNQHGNYHAHMDKVIESWLSFLGIRISIEKKCFHVYCEQWEKKTFILHLHRTRE